MRVLSGLGQIELSARVEVGSGVISMIENDKVDPTPQTLQRLARHLKCTPEYLHRESDLELTSGPWMRAYADAPQKALDVQLAEIETAFEAIHTHGFPQMADILPTLIGDDPHNPMAVERLALDVRNAADIPDTQPVGNVIRAAERLGCLVLPMSEELGRHLGLSARINTRPVICVSRPHVDVDASIPGDRQRFTVAHELGHLALHSTMATPTNSEAARLFEKQAHRFAAAFLIPGDALVDELSRGNGRITLTKLADIKGRWGIAIKALVGRVRDLGIIDEDHARSLYKQISARGWNRNEPVPVGNESAQWLQRTRRALAAPPSGKLDTISGLDTSHFDRWTTWTPIETTTNGAKILHLKRG